MRRPRAPLRRTAPRPSNRPALIGTAGVGVVAVLFAMVFLWPGAASTAAPSPSAAAATGQDCPEGWLPVHPVHPPGDDGFDSNVNVYVHGTFSATAGAAEAEGLLVVRGGASFAKTGGGTYNVGVAGVGSGVSPPGGDDMLLVGGDVAVGAGTRVDVGAGFARGGNVRTGGTISGPGTVETNHGTITPHDPHALEHWTTFDDTLATRSAQWAAYPTTGQVARRVVKLRPRLVLHGDGHSTRQVFDVPASELAGVVEVQFTGVPADAAVYVNVTGGPLDLSVSSFLAANGTVLTGQPFVDLATHLMWNVRGATEVTVGGYAQYPGSFLIDAPGNDTTVSAPGTNGRLYTRGSLTHAGSGSELHAYPFLDDDTTTCLPPDLVVTPTPTPSPPDTDTPEPITPTPPDSDTPEPITSTPEPGTPSGPEPERPSTPGSSTTGTYPSGYPSGYPSVETSVGEPGYTYPASDGVPSPPGQDPSVAPTRPPTVPPGGTLPETGAGDAVAPVAVLGVLCTLAGVAVVRVGRRRH